MLCNVCLKPFSEFFTSTDLRLREAAIFLAEPPIPPTLTLRTGGCSRISLVLHCNWKYYAKQPLLKVNWANFWKLFVSWRNFQTWLISAPSSSPPKYPRRKSHWSKKLYILVIYNFCSNIFFVSGLFKKLFSKNQNFNPLTLWKVVKICTNFKEVQEY